LFEELEQPVLLIVMDLTLPLLLLLKLVESVPDLAFGFLLF
jgi:hypothetical protein